MVEPHGAVCSAAAAVPSPGAGAPAIELGNSRERTANRSRIRTLKPRHPPGLSLRLRSMGKSHCATARFGVYPSAPGTTAQTRTTTQFLGPAYAFRGGVNQQDMFN